MKGVSPGDIGVVCLLFPFCYGGLRWALKRWRMSVTLMGYFKYYGSYVFFVVFRIVFWLYLNICFFCTSYIYIYFQRCLPLSSSRSILCATCWRLVVSFCLFDLFQRHLQIDIRLLWICILLVVLGNFLYILLFEAYFQALYYDVL